MPNCHLFIFKGSIQPQNAKTYNLLTFKNLGLSLAFKKLVTIVMKYMLSFNSLLRDEIGTSDNDDDGHIDLLYYVTEDVRQRQVLARILDLRKT